MPQLLALTADLQSLNPTVIGGLTGGAPDSTDVATQTHDAELAAALGGDAEVRRAEQAEQSAQTTAIETAAAASQAGGAAATQQADGAAQVRVANPPRRSNVLMVATRRTFSRRRSSPARGRVRGSAGWRSWRGCALCGWSWRG